VTERVGEIFLKINGNIGGVVQNCRLLELWTEVVDERVSRNTEPIKIRNRTLHISTKTAVWAQELSFLKQQIIRKFNDKAGIEVISDIRFKTMEVG
jgi:predicted nucleic acid-binding Zn ribbon protein